MISIRKHIEKSEGERQLLAEMETSYADALEGIAESFLPVSEELAAENRKQVRQLLKDVSQELDVQLVGGVRSKLRNLLRSYSERGGEILECKDKEVKRILRVFTEAVAALAANNKTDDGRLTGFTRDLESIITINDLPEIRKRLTREVSELKQIAASMHERNQSSVEELQSRLHSFQEKLAQTERIAQTDGLTELANRRSGEQAVEALIASRKPFCIVLFDLNGFKGVNDRWGHQAGDSMLVQFARRLRLATRSMDTVCRWGGDEFLVLLAECGLAQAVERGKQIAKSCEGEYELEVLGQRIRVMLSAARGVAEHKSGESMETLFRRADEIMYKVKGKDVAAGHGSSNQPAVVLGASHR